jgi:plasmid stabilization system protein ParE
MLRILKRLIAQKDVKKIWSYTYQKWGELQANKYLAGLNETVVSLAENPSLGRHRLQ